MNKLFNRGFGSLSDLSSDSVHLVILTPSSINLRSYSTKYRYCSYRYNEYIKKVEELISLCSRVLLPGCKLCVCIEPIFISGRTKARIVLDDVIRYTESENGMAYHSLFIWEKKELRKKMSSFGSMPYPTEIFSAYPYQWIVVFSKKGVRPPVNQLLMEQSKITYEEWEEWVQKPIWELPLPEEHDIDYHSTPFPIDLPYRLIKLFSYAGDIVLDPLTETGITVLAAQRLERRFIGFNAHDKEEIIERLKSD
jgi:modification methylase